MSKIAKLKKDYVILLIIGLLFAAFPLFIKTTYIYSFLIITFMYAALTVGWNIMGGYAGYFSFGHVAFVGAGGYLSAFLLLEYGWSPFLTAPLAGLLAGIIALLVGYPCLKLRGPYFSVVTLIVALAVQVVVVNIPGLDAPRGLFLPSPADNVLLSRMLLYEGMLVLLLISIAVAMYIENSRLGYGLYAIREDEEVAETQGVNTTELKLIGYIISAFLAGMVGSVFAWYQGFLAPDPMFELEISVLIVLMALIGGTYSWVGALGGAVVISIVREFLMIYVGAEASHILFGVLLIVAIMYLPHGAIKWAIDKKFSKSPKGCS